MIRGNWIVGDKIAMSCERHGRPGAISCTGNHRFTQIATELTLKALTESFVMYRPPVLTWSDHKYDLFQERYWISQTNTLF